VSWRDEGGNPEFFFFTRAQIKQKKFQGRKPEMGYITRAKNTINPII